MLVAQPRPVELVEPDVGHGRVVDVARRGAARARRRGARRGSRGAAPRPSRRRRRRAARSRRGRSSRPCRPRSITSSMRVERVEALHVQRVQAGAGVAQERLGVELLLPRLGVVRERRAGRASTLTSNSTPKPALDRGGEGGAAVLAHRARAVEAGPMCEDVGARDRHAPGSRPRRPRIEGAQVGRGRPITAGVVARLSLDVLMDRPEPARALRRAGHLPGVAVPPPAAVRRRDVVGRRAAATRVLCWDETSLLTDPRVRAHACEGLFVFVCHDWWCHPLALVRELRRRPRVLLGAAPRLGAALLRPRRARPAEGRAAAGRRAFRVPPALAARRRWTCCSRAARRRTIPCGSG